MIRLADLPADLPILIAGPTASGKSALALELAATAGGVVINADALQVYDCWQVLTARPGAADLARALHALYGHIPADRAYSTGDWLRDVIPYLEGPRRPIIVGGTGLYFAALTEGLADIPPTPPDIRSEADARMARDARGVLAELDAATRARIDTANPARVQRAWEVQRTTGRGLAEWHAETPPPHLPEGRFVGLHIASQKDWLNARIAARFDAMLSGGAIEEARALRPRWSPDLPAAKAIGAAELMAYLDGRMTLDEVRERGVILTRQYAKRQRTWFRARMSHWRKLLPTD